MRSNLIVTADFIGTSIALLLPLLGIRYLLGL